MTVKHGDYKDVNVQRNAKTYCLHILAIYQEFAQVIKQKELLKALKS